MDKPWYVPDRKGFLALAAITLFGTVIMALMFKAGPADTTIFAVLTTLLGVLAGVIKDVYGYDFGSSASGATKDETISKMVVPQPNGTGGGSPAAIIAAAEAAAPPAAAVAAPPAVDAELERRGIPDKPKE